ncbi:hypothetical protein ACWCYZ_00885 [Streptomyces virginiae]
MIDPTSSAAPSPEATAEPATAAPSAPLDPADLRAEVEKWKGLSRKNEKAFKDASKELSEFRTAAMTDQERALEQARAEARTAAFTEVGGQLVAAELRAQAATAGAQLPDADFLNLSRFVGQDGRPDTNAISAFVATLSAPKAQPTYRQDLGLGRQGSAQAGQLSRSDLTRMTPAQINEARSKGLLDAVMRGEL